MAGSLVSLGVRQKEVLQSSFDLLGELVKFNVRAFRQLDKVLSTEAKVGSARGPRVPGGSHPRWGRRRDENSRDEFRPSCLWRERLP